MDVENVDDSLNNSSQEILLREIISLSDAQPDKAERIAEQVLIFIYKTKLSSGTCSNQEHGAEYLKSHLGLGIRERRNEFD